MKRKCKFISGFTLIEAIISIAIFAIFLISFLSIILTTYKTALKAKQQYRATNLAQKHFEELKASDNVVKGESIHEHEGLIVREEIIEPVEYEGRLYHIRVHVSVDEHIMETIEGIKIIKK